jgi:hypothetical protein
MRRLEVIFWAIVREERMRRGATRIASLYMAQVQFGYSDETVMKAEQRKGCTLAFELRSK